MNTFAWAVEQLKHGERVRRANWHTGSYIEQKNNNLRGCFFEHKSMFTFSWEDVNAENWEVRK